MLGKLLKYDLKYVYKYWWIGAIASFLMSIFGGVCFNVLIQYMVKAFGAMENESDFDLTLLLGLMAYAGMMTVYLAFWAFSLLTSILIYVRFYKNFFSDEGYLTFTLPVKIGTLLNSKIVSAVLLNLSYSAVIGINMATVFAIGLIGNWSEIIPALIKELPSLIPELFGEFGVYLIIYPTEIILIGLLSTIVSYLFTYCCITLASVITKKARVITSIGIYYVATSIVSTVYYAIFRFGFSSVALWLAQNSWGEIKLAIAVIMLVVVLFVAILCSILYVLQYWMIDRKLNMA